MLAVTDDEAIVLAAVHALPTPSLIDVCCASLLELSRRTELPPRQHASELRAQLPTRDQWLAGEQDAWKDTVAVAVATADQVRAAR